MTNNPVLNKELFLRLRMHKVPVPGRIVLIGITAVSVFTIYYEIIVKWILGDSGNRSGYDAFCLMVGIQASLICLIAPIITANCITQEKEQQTWEMLISTKLTPGEIIFGKLAGRISALGLMMLLFAPIEIVCWFKSPTDISGLMVFFTTISMMLMALFFATFGLYISWVLSKTIYAIMAAYTFVIGFLTVGTALFSGLLSMFLSEEIFYKCPLMWINPGMLMFESMNPKDSANTMLFLVYGLIVYLILTMLIIWRMTIGFRRYAYKY